MENLLDIAFEPGSELIDKLLESEATSIYWNTVMTSYWDTPMTAYWSTTMDSTV